MEWKEFFKFSWKKLLIVIGLLILTFFIWFITIFALMDVTSNASKILLYLYYAIAPFSLVPFIGLFLNIVYFYLMACIFSYSIAFPEKRTFFVLIGIGLIFVMIIIGTTSYFLWNKAYIDMINKAQREQIEGPYGSSEYLGDVWILNNARTMIIQNRFDAALTSCNQINSEATFNNGESIQQKCLSELEAKKGGT